MKTQILARWFIINACAIGFCHLIATFTPAQIRTTFTEPITTTELAAAENGIIRKINVKEGDFVTKSMIIAELDQQVLKKSLLLAVATANSNAAIERANAQLELATKKRKSLKKLEDDGHANKNELQNAEYEYQIALADMKLAKDEKTAAQIEVQRIEAQIEQRVIRSPFDGTIVKIHKKVGEYISTAEPQFATIVVLKKLRARFYLLHQQAEFLQVDDQVTVKIKEQTTQARVVFVSPIIDPDSRTIRVEIEIDNRNNQFASGVHCQWVGTIDAQHRQANGTNNPGTPLSARSVQNREAPNHEF